jgi:hypothetical protein
VAWLVVATAGPALAGDFVPLEERRCLYLYGTEVCDDGWYTEGDGRWCADGWDDFVRTVDWGDASASQDSDIRPNGVTAVGSAEASGYFCDGCCEDSFPGCDCRRGGEAWSWLELTFEQLSGTTARLVATTGTDHSPWRCFVELRRADGSETLARIEDDGALDEWIELDTGTYVLEAWATAQSTSPERTSAFAVELVVDTCAGDADQSGRVDVADVLTILASWGPCSPAPCLADMNGDGVVDAVDLDIVLDSWGGCA